MSVSSFEVNAAAAMRDYYVEPRLGRFLAGGSETLDYRTISGVNGPLVVLENVKVGERCACVIFLGTPFL